MARNRDGLSCISSLWIFFQLNVNILHEIHIKKHFFYRKLKFSQSWKYSTCHKKGVFVFVADKTGMMKDMNFSHPAPHPRSKILLIKDKESSLGPITFSKPVLLLLLWAGFQGSVPMHMYRNYDVHPRCSTVTEQCATLQNVHIVPFCAFPNIWIIILQWFGFFDPR